MKTKKNKRTSRFGLDWSTCSTGNASSLGGSKEIFDLTATVGGRYRQHLRDVVREIYTHAAV